MLRWLHSGHQSIDIDDSRFICLVEGYHADPRLCSPELPYIEKSQNTSNLFCKTIVICHVQPIVTYICNIVNIKLR